MTAKKHSIYEKFTSRSLFLSGLLILVLLIISQSTGAAISQVDGAGASGFISKWVSGSAPPPPGSVSCTAPVLTTPTNGECGASLNTCVKGTFADKPDSSTSFLWECRGSNRGSSGGEGITAQCSLPKLGSFQLQAAGNIVVNFGIIPPSRSTKTTITVVPMLGFAENVTLSVLQVRDVNGAIVSIPGFTPLFDPNPLSSPTFTSGSQFSVSVSNAAADPDVDKLYTMTVLGKNPSGSITGTVTVGLTLRASNPGFEEQ